MNSIVDYKQVWPGKQIRRNHPKYSTQKSKKMGDKRSSGDKGDTEGRTNTFNEMEILK